MTRTILSAALVLVAISYSATADTSRGAHSGFAVVGSDGTLERGSNTTGAIHLGTGIYEVDFASSVKKCAYTATIALPGSSGVNAPGFVTVAGRSDTVDGVYLKTFDQKGDLADTAFQLNVRC
ncbi:MAG TPA: hypothetical protein VMF58_15890 [Rhizomicrobium sp.]|nr:hypothetical protein [Rhizomicrobium sp.]